MGDVKNLTAAEAGQKIKELAEAANTCFFTTNLAVQPAGACPMATIKADEDGCLWFFSDEKSAKNADIQKDNKVQLYYANGSSAEYLSLYGTATILKDAAKAKELWTPLAKAWFPGGAEDPALTIIKVQPRQAYYWDTKHGKVIALLQIAAGVLTGKAPDDGIQGTIQP